MSRVNLSELFKVHHEQAEDCAHHLEDLSDGMATSSRGLILALLGVAAAERAQAVELRRIRRALERLIPAGGGAIELHLTGTLVAKQGGRDASRTVQPHRS